jgi:hypothetical protein
MIIVFPKMSEILSDKCLAIYDRDVPVNACRSSCHEVSVTVPRFWPKLECVDTKFHENVFSDCRGKATERTDFIWHFTLEMQKQSYVTTDGLSVSLSWCRAALGHMTRYYFLSKDCFFKVAVSSLWGALSDKRLGLSFVSLSVVICQYV